MIIIGYAFEHLAYYRHDPSTESIAVSSLSDTCIVHEKEGDVTTDLSAVDLVGSAPLWPLFLMHASFMKKRETLKRTNQRYTCSCRWEHHYNLSFRYMPSLWERGREINGISGRQLPLHLTHNITCKHYNILFLFLFWQVVMSGAAHPLRGTWLRVAYKSYPKAGNWYLHNSLPVEEMNLPI